MTIDIIIPNYNGSKLVAKNLPVVLKSISTYKNISVRVVDDGSREEERAAVKNVIEEIKKTSKTPIVLMENTKNVGFSSNVNRGAFASNADLLVFLNSDVAPEDKFLDSIVPHFEKNEKLFGVGCMDKSIEGNTTITRGRGVGRWVRGFLVHSRGEINKTDTLWVSCGSCVVRREFFVKVLKGLDSLYDPFYWEDIDLSYRAQKYGFEVMFEKNSIVEHRHEEGAIKTHYKNNKIQTIAYRNQITFIWKNISDNMFLLSHILWLPYYFAKTLGHGDTTFTKGFFAAVFRLPMILKHRTAQKKNYVKSDRDILMQFIVNR